MNAEDKYLFDLNGFIVVRGVFTASEMAEANEAVDRHEVEAQERMHHLRNSEAATPLSGDGVTGRKDLGKILEWGSKDSRVFREVLTHPKLLPYFHTLLGHGYRMDHLPFIISQEKGSEGHALHGGTIDNVSGQYNPYLAYTCINGSMHNHLLAVSVVLTDHNEGDGGFVVVRGSHKSNFAMPPEMTNGFTHSEHVYQPVTKAGDVILFSEGTVHGTRPWTSEKKRRAALYRFAPPTACYSKSYYPSWQPAITEGMTPAQLAVLEPPYALRLERPYVNEEGEVTRQRRPSFKKEFDAKVFGKPSF